MHVHCPRCQATVELTSFANAEGPHRCPSCESTFAFDGAHPTTDWAAREPRKVGKYELVEVVGQGAFGTVWRGRDPELGREVAVKVPRAGGLAGPHDRERFLREARSAAQLRHPSIVTVHDVGTFEGVPFLVSELVRGVTLADLLSGRRPSFRESAELVAAIADALHYAHQQGVVHRDVKPSNVILEAGGPPRVMDFGLARRDAADESLTAEGQVLGTPAYMSPEQARGEGHEADGRTDVYSLGVVLYQCLTGELPFRGTQRMLLHQVLNDEPRPPRSLNDAVPRDLETVCLQAMAKEPQRRYKTAGELADELRRWLRGEPVRARPVGRFGRAWRWARRNPAVASLTAAVVAVTLAGLGAFAWQFVEAVVARGEAEHNASLANTNQLAAEGLARREREEREAKEKSLQREARAAEHTREVLYVTRCNLAAAALRAGDLERAGDLLLAMRPAKGERDLRGFEWHLLDRLVNAGRREVPLEGAHTLGEKVRRTPILFTHDGRHAYRLEEYEMRAWDTTTGKTVRKTALRPGAYMYVQGGYQGQALWSQVQVRLYDGKGPAKEVVLVDPATGATSPIARRIGVRFASTSRSITFSPDGRRGLWVGVPGPRAVVFDRASGKVTAELALPDEPQVGNPLVHWTEDGRWLKLTTTLRAGPSAEGTRVERLYDPATGKRRFAQLGDLKGLTFSGDGRHFAHARTGQPGVVVRDAATGTEVAAIDPGPELAAAAQAGDFVLGDDGQRLLVGNRLFDLAGRAPPAVLHGLKWSRNPAVSGDRLQPLTSYLGGRVVYNPAPPPRVDREGRVWALSILGTVTRYQPPPGHFQAPARLYQQNPTTDSRAARATVAGLDAWENRQDTTLCLLDLARGRRLVAPLPDRGPRHTSRPVISGDGNRVLLSGGLPPYEDQRWLVSRTPRLIVGRAEAVGSLVLHLTGAPHPAAALLRVVSAAGTRALYPYHYGGKPSAGEVRVWDVRQGRWVFERRFTADFNDVPSSLSPTGEWLALGTRSERPNMRLFHVGSGREVALEGLPDVTGVRGWNSALSPDGRRFAWASYGVKEVHQEGQPLPPRQPTRMGIWGLPGGKLEGLVALPKDLAECSVLQLRFSPDGGRVVGLVAVPWEGPRRPRDPWRVRGGYLVIASAFLERIVDTSEVWDNHMALHLLSWRTGGGKPPALERRLELGLWEVDLGNHAWGRSLCFSPDGKLLATANFLPGRLSEVKVWDLAGGQALHTMRAPGGPNWDRPYLAFTRDGRRLLTGGRLWDVSTGLELLTLTEALVSGRDESGEARAFLLDGDVARSVFVNKDDVRVYAYDGSR